MTFSYYVLATFLSFLLLTFNFVNVIGDEDHEFHSSGEFTLTNGRTFSLLNVHRHTEPTLTFDLPPNISINVGAQFRFTEHHPPERTTREFSLYDGSKIRLRIQRKVNITTEFTVIWIPPPNKPEVVENSRELCFDLGNNHPNTFWYSTHQSPIFPTNYPMSTNKTTPKTPFNYLHDWQTTKTEYAHILEHLIVSTQGFAILPDPQQPLFIRKSPNKLCFSAEQRPPYNLRTGDRSYLNLKIHIFASTNIRTVTNYVVHSSGHLPRPSEPPEGRLFSQTLWTLLAQEGLKTEVQQLDYFMNQAKLNGFTSRGQLQLTSNWKFDNFMINFHHHPRFDEKLPEIHQNGFTLLAPVMPNPFRNSLNTQKYFIHNSSGDKVEFVDFSNPKAANWFETLLRVLHYEDGVDSFFFESQSFSPDLALADPKFEKYPNYLITAYLEAASRVGANGSCTRVAFKSQHLPLFLQLTGNIDGRRSSQEMLRSVVSSALTASIGGYSWLLPFRVGSVASNRPSEELYIRWLQATALMPRMAIHSPPWEVSPRATKRAQECIQLHRSFEDLFVKLAKIRVTEGHPVIRPLWYEAPEDPKTYPIDDQFLLGDKILVAPVLSEGTTLRKVYLPRGVWVNELEKDSQPYQGEEFYRVAAPREKLLYFRRTS